jgi:hypothetical protein
MSIHMLFDQLKVGQIFERKSRLLEDGGGRYMKVAAFCVARFDSEGRFSHTDNTTCNSINLKNGKPVSFTGWEYVVVLDTCEIPSPSKKESEQTQSAVVFDDCDGGNDDGVCVAVLDNL